MQITAPLTEPIAIMDIYVHGVHEAEHIGNGCLRITYFSFQKSIHDGTMERVVVARHVIHAAEAQAMSVTILESAGRQTVVCRSCKRDGLFH